jgi:nitrite reductase/ring-hydroxylating ferredoxin subunit/alkylhydroperoxidase/carboxymuconolactone decarboxylase family protein YurZ
MSAALDYLLKARPEALGHYFKFMAEAGRHLDPKTRSLISVITKVDAQTRAGFKQYLKRALKDGAKPAEVLDALLMAFPTLGLTKILWAIDILQSMNLPEFRLEALTGSQDWRPLGQVDQFTTGETVRLEITKRPLFVYRGEVGFQVYDGYCPHRNAAIPEGCIKGSRIVCPSHGWEFDGRSGFCTHGGDGRLEILPNRVVGTELQSYW